MQVNEGKLCVKISKLYSISIQQQQKRRRETTSVKGFNIVDPQSAQYCGWWKARNRIVDDPQLAGIGQSRLHGPPHRSKVAGADGEYRINPAAADGQEQGLR